MILGGPTTSSSLGSRFAVAASSTTARSPVTPTNVAPAPPRDAGSFDEPPRNEGSFDEPPRDAALSPLLGVWVDATTVFGVPPRPLVTSVATPEFASDSSRWSRETLTEAQLAVAATQKTSTAGPKRTKLLSFFRKDLEIVGLDLRKP
jgi:hypothetical protein